MRSVMTPRLETVTGAGARRAIAVVPAEMAGVVGTDRVDVDLVDVDLVGVDLVATDRFDATLEEDLRPLLVLVLKGFAMGARLIVPSDFTKGFAGGRFLEVAIGVAREAALPEMARKRRAAVRRRSNIYCTSVGLATLSGLAEVTEMTGAGSFGWGPG
jgi:hypothetical protein